MSHALCLLLVFGLTILVLHTNGYQYIEPLNTENGFCEGPDYGKIAVGETGYNDESCEKINCHYGYREVFGCGNVVPSNDPMCRLDRGKGNYPNCCPQIVCI